MPAVTVKQPAVLVVVKVQCARRFFLELSVLQQLSGTAGVVRWKDFFPCGPNEQQFALVLPRLNPVNYDAVRAEMDSIAKFADEVAGIVKNVHAQGWAHGDIKPEAFMCEPTSGAAVLTDFNLAGRASDWVPDSHRASGTPGWVLNNTPAKRREHGDLVGLASVLGWLLSVDGFGDPNTTHARALVTSRADFALAKCRGNETRACLLGKVCKLLNLKSVSVVWRRVRRWGFF